MSGRRYRKVEMILWADKRFRALADDTKIIWLYLLTSHRTTYCPGLVLASEVIIADDLGWFDDDPATGLSRVRESLRELEGLGWVEIDAEAKVMWVPNAVRHNIPDNPNQVKGWHSTFNEIPRSPLKRAWRDRAYTDMRDECGGTSQKFKVFVDLFGKPEGDVPETMAKPSVNLGPTKPKTGTGTGTGTGAGSKTRTEPGADSAPDLSVPVDFSRRQIQTLEAVATASFWLAERGEVTLASAVKDPVGLARRLGGPAYPALDPGREIHKAGNWTMENPKKAKRDLGRFLTNWFNRAQERGGERAGPGGGGQSYPHDNDLTKGVKGGKR